MLCLGTSLVITPACDIPLLAKRKRKHKPNGGRVAIINLQATQHDKRAALVVCAWPTRTPAASLARSASRPTACACVRLLARSTPESTR